MGDINGWTHEDEKVLSEWADKAACYIWMHDLSHKEYNKIYLWFTIPVIILQTVMGTANFAQDSIPEDMRTMFSMSIGAVTIISGIIATISQTLKIAELKEAHRNSGKQWDKFSRNIKVELIKNPRERIPKKNMMEISKKEYDRLVESSPIISDDVIKRFIDIFKDANITKPEICNEITPTEIFKRIEAAGPIIIEIDPIKKRREELSTRFLENNGRLPTDDEIVDMMELES